MTRPTVSPTDIQQVFLFSGIDGELLDGIQKATTRIEIGTGQPLFNVGEPVTHFYFVESGRILLSRSSSAGDEKVIALIGPSETFAEAMMFGSHQHGYPVDARAIEPSCLLRFGVPTMREILAQSPECCFRVMGSMCSRLRELVVQIDEITLHNGTYRLVAYLLRQLPPDAEHARDIQLSIRKNVIASRLSLQPETFSRILANLRKADLLDTEGAHIVLKDVGGLRRLLEA